MPALHGNTPLVFHRLVCIKSGGQTGVDQAAWMAAKPHGLITAGAMPQGFLTEAGPKPEFREMFNAMALDSSHYADRTIANLRSSDGTLLLINSDSSEGTRLALLACVSSGKPLFLVDPEKLEPRADAPAFRDWLEMHQIRILNVAGDRESVRPGIYAQAFAYLESLFHMVLNRPAT